MRTYMLKCHTGTWVTVSEDDLNNVRAFFPELVFKVLQGDEDVTAEYLASMRTALIYG